MIRRLLLAIASRLPASLLNFLFKLRWRGRLPRTLTLAAQRLIRNRDAVILRGPGVGLRFNPGDSNISYLLGLAEPLVQAALGEHLGRGMVFYDVGANVGFLTLIGARLVGATGRVVAFEPHPASAAALRHNAALNGFAHVTVVARAVGRAAGTAKLALREESTLARLAAPGETGPTVDVEMVAIDDLVAAGAIRPPALVKIDVEGAELEVIAGMRRTIAAHRPTILCEMHGTNAAFAAQMAELEYGVTALESPLPLAEAPWDVHALAAPRRSA
ncbi:MAG: hypothetical protein A2083_05765 [Gemmatimonadetes bacterium GWC2_71_9]|nr:MAG: hypothetical protein A2083_05765 [Gemmatimonadetes bacterium GWC2_71_9]OGT96821.1 MAG: hypothetical protein A3I79_07200 [Gemmatimonadetes bacterium RIFCSPLOWO2_02_FULL_71_11]